MARGVQSPEKELRFTRSGQAPLFWLAAAVLLAAAVTLAVTSSYRDVNPDLPHPAWAVPPALLALACARLALRLTRHAYLILTPIGIEIFPFFRPAAGMQMISWAEIHSAEIDAGGTRLTLHHDAGKTSGVHLTLRPIRADRRGLLTKAVTGRMGQGGG